MKQKTFDEYQDSGIDYTDEQTLRRLYWNEELSTREIADLAGVHKETIIRHMDKHDIKRRDRIVASKEGSRIEYCPYIVDHQGYCRWRDTWDKTWNMISVARLLAVAENGFDAIKEKVVHHKNGIKWDNRPSNIELMDRPDHTRMHNSGENSAPAKLTTSEVREIRQRYKNEDISYKDLAEEYGVSTGTIGPLIRKETWTHIE